MYELTCLFEEMISVLKQAGISCQGVFLNADPGFDSGVFQQICDKKDIQLNVKPNKRNKKEATLNYRYFDEELYKRRTKMEHAHAWTDAFKAS